MTAHWLLLTTVLIALTTRASAQETETVWPSPDWPSATPSDVGLDASRLEAAKRYSLTAGGSGMILRHGKSISRWGDQQKRYDIKSATKSFGATMLGVAIKDQKVKLNDLATQHHKSFGVPPGSNVQTGWLNKVTLAHLATQTAGFEKRGGYEPLLFEPGTQWHYSDGGPNWLAECLTLLYERDLQDVMFDRIFSPLGITRSDLQWRNNQYRDHQIQSIARREFGAGIHANVEALSRLGYLYLREGRWRNEQLLTQEFVRLATRPVKSVVGLPEWDAEKSHGNASDHYGLLWWNNADKTLQAIPRDAYWAWGLYDSLIVVIPSLDLVVIRAGEPARQLPRKENENHYDVLAPFLTPIVEAAKPAEQLSKPNAPYPPSEFIIGIEWAPPESIIRQAKGSDNWPLTWGDDDLLYTAYGDGWGFEPMTKEKLSLGLASIQGGPTDFRGINIRSSDGEKSGQGGDGQKASGMLMVDGVLYVLVRNAGNSQLGWSQDHGATWQWADWKWTKSFGCPTFLNFGRDYSGRPDHVKQFVYVYSHDSHSAYEAADRMVLARVPQDRIRARNAYEFFAGIDPGSGQAKWSKDIDRRTAVFDHAGNCYRSGITYNAGLKRFLWCQTLPNSTDSRGPRFQGGFGIYESPSPWGPWRTVYYTTDWDVGPGETSSLPTKWMSKDGRTVQLVFSGDDHFSVRKATLSLGQD